VEPAEPLVAVANRAELKAMPTGPLLGGITLPRSGGPFALALGGPPPVSEDGLVGGELGWRAGQGLTARLLGAYSKEVDRLPSA